MRYKTHVAAFLGYAEYYLMFGWIVFGYIKHFIRGAVEAIMDMVFMASI